MRKLIFMVALSASLSLLAACGDDDEDVPEDNGDATATGEPQNNGDRPPEVSGESTTTDSGLEYIETEEGAGEQPTVADTVLVHYTGWIHPDGPKFDSSVDRGQPASFPLAGVIQGFSEGIQMMKEGGKARLIMPPEIAYGETGQGPIPPNATLIFDVELIEIQ